MRNSNNSVSFPDDLSSSGQRIKPAAAAAAFLGPPGGREENYGPALYISISSPLPPAESGIFHCSLRPFSYICLRTSWKWSLLSLVSSRYLWYSFSAVRASSVESWVDDWMLMPETNEKELINSVFRLRPLDIDAWGEWRFFSSHMCHIAPCLKRSEGSFFSFLIYLFFVTFVQY